MPDPRTLLITGASSGIGAATARHAVAAGFHVALAARSQDKLARLVAELGAERARTYALDVTDYGAIEAVVARIVAEHGSLHAVFANAGVTGERGGFSCAPTESWRRIVDVNILGVAYTLRATLGLIKAVRGHIVITGSIAGRQPLRGSMYSVSKWAVRAIAYNLRAELEGSGVRVTLLEPGVTDTPFFDEPKPQSLSADDVARAAIFALTQPQQVDVHELVVLPTAPLRPS